MDSAALTPNAAVDRALDRSHGNWSRAASSVSYEMESSGFRHAMDGRDAESTAPAYRHGFDVGLGFRYPISAGQLTINRERFGRPRFRT